MQEYTLTEAQVKLLLSFAPRETAEQLPRGLNATFYHTLSYEGDYKLCQGIDKIRALIENGNN